MSLDLESLVQSLKSRFADIVGSVSEFRNETTVYIKKENILDVLGFIKSDFDFTFLAELTAIDLLEIKAPRYEVVYILHRFGVNHEENIRIRIKAQVSAEDMTIESVTSIWKGADWLEREVYDMFGIEFAGHPDLRRILMPEDYEPYPLRKDFDVRNREDSKQSFERALKERDD